MCACARRREACVDDACVCARVFGCALRRFALPVFGLRFALPVFGLRRFAWPVFGLGLGLRRFGLRWFGLRFG